MGKFHLLLLLRLLTHAAETLSVVAGMILVCAKQYISREILGIAEEPRTLPSALCMGPME